MAPYGDRSRPVATTGAHKLHHSETSGHLYQCLCPRLVCMWHLHRLRRLSRPDVGLARSLRVQASVLCCTAVHYCTTPLDMACVMMYTHRAMPSPQRQGGLTACSRSGALAGTAQRRSCSKLHRHLICCSACEFTAGHREARYVVACVISLCSPRACLC